MSKIFQTQFHKGSWIEGVSDSLITPGTISFPFRRSEKGIVAQSLDNAFMVFPSDIALSENGASIIFSGKGWNYSTNSNEYIIGTSASTIDNTFGRYSTILRLNSNTSGQYWLNYTPSGEVLRKLREGYWHIAIVADGGAVKTYLNGELLDTETPSDGVTFNRFGQNFNGEYIGIQLYDHALTEKERAKLYNEFLRATPTTKIIQ